MQHDRDMGSEIRARIEAAFNRLNLSAGTNERVRCAVATLVQIAMSAPNRRPGDAAAPARRKKKQLTALAKAASDFVQAIDDLPEASIALSETKFLVRAEPREWALETAELARQRADAIAIKTSTKPPKIVARLIAACLAHEFEALTGKRATKITDPVTGKLRGPFFDLVTDVFAAMNIHASAATFVDQVTRPPTRRKKRPVKRLRAKSER
jgi:hypothetical protein